MVSLLRSGWPSSASSSLAGHRNLTSRINAHQSEISISNNVGSVKYFLSALRRSLRRVVFLVLFAPCINDHGSFIIFRSASVRPKHLFDPYFDHD